MKGLNVMKKQIIFLGVVFCVAMSYADAVKKAATNDAERIRMRQELRARRLIEAGGIVVLEQDSKIIRIVNAQQRIKEDVLVPVRENMGRILNMPVEISSLEATTANDAVAKGFKLPKTGAVVAIVAANETPALMVAPEEGWSVINVTALADDFPPENVLAVRLQKEIWRAAALAVGGCISYTQPCLLAPVAKPSDLDTLKLVNPSPEAIMKMCNAAPSRGIKAIKKATYRRACQEGWAPLPTNDVQRAIWEKVKADKERVPTKPITIPPPNAKK